MPDGAAEDASGLVAVGRVRRAHGVHGVLAVESLTSDGEAVFAVGRRLFAGTVRGDPVDPPVALHVEWVEPFMGGFRIQFTEIQGRDEAVLWRHRYLLAPGSELPPPDEDEILLQDLIGFLVERENGDVVGKVVAYYELRHDVLIEVSRPVGTVLIPYREEFIVSVDPDAKLMVVEPPEGLL